MKYEVKFIPDVPAKNFKFEFILKFNLIISELYRAMTQPTVSVCMDRRLILLPVNRSAP